MPQIIIKIKDDIQVVYHDSWDNRYKNITANIVILLS